MKEKEGQGEKRLKCPFHFLRKWGTDPQGKREGVKRKGISIDPERCLQSNWKKREILVDI